MSKTNAPNVSGPGEPDKLREIALSPPALPCAEEGDEGKDDEKGDEEEEGLGLLAASVAARAYVPFIRKPADDVCVELGEEDGEEEEVERQEAEKEEEEVEQEGKAAVPPSVPYALELRSLLADLLDGPPPVVSSPPAVCASPPPSRVSPPPRRQPPAAAQQRDPRRSMPTTTQGRLLPHQPRVCTRACFCLCV